MGMGNLWYNVRVRRSEVPSGWRAAGRGLGLALSGAALLRVWRPERSTVDVAATAASPWLLAPSWGLLAGALVTRQRGLTVLAASLAAFHVACLRRLTATASTTPEGPDGPGLSVAFANLWCHNSDVTGVVAELARGHHDIVAMAEVTDEHVPMIDVLLPSAVFPWRRIEPDPSPGSEGLALVSRVPLSHVETWSSQGHPQFDAVVVAPNAGAFRLLLVHTWGPVGRARVRAWHRQLAEVAARARDRAGAPPPRALPVVMMGDFNATRQHRSFDGLLQGGWDDAGTLRFGGWRGTWPANRRWLPALFRIDHVLAGPGIAVCSGRAWNASGSDHRPVSAVLRLPPAPGGWT
jgi:endonuclease/exonuclease/phosphatase (EEP) superfamily protein YafD